jgi:hypothetical protein
MTQEIIRMAREAGFNVEQGFLLRITGIDEDLKRFAALAQSVERNKLAAWMIAQGYATGHGDTIEQLLDELRWQVREACLTCYSPDDTAQDWADKIRARGNT